MHLPAPAAVGVAGSTALGRGRWGRWGGGCAGVQLWEGSWLSPRTALWVRAFGSPSGSSRDAEGRRVHLAVRDSVGLRMGHLPASGTAGSVPRSASAAAAKLGMRPGCLKRVQLLLGTHGYLLGSLQGAASPLAFD